MKSAFQPSTAYEKHVTLFASIKREIVITEIMGSGSVKGSKLPSVRAIAKKYRISPTTVMRVVNELTDEGIIQASAKKGLFLKDPKKCGRYAQRGSLISVIVNTTGYYYSDVLREIESAAAIRGYFLLIQNIGWGYRELNALIAMHLSACHSAGLIVRLPEGYDDTAPFEAARKSGVPVVFIDSALPGFPADSITVDNHRGAFIGTEHLLRHGHRNIAFLRDAQLTRSSIESARFSGYTDALSASGIAPRKALDLMISAGDMRNDNTSVLDLIRREKVTAFMCYNDMYAHWLIDYCGHHGVSVPGDLSVVGFDNVPPAQGMAHALTTLDPDKEAMGKKAIELIFSRIDAPFAHHSPEHLVHIPRLAAGTTVAHVKK